MALQMDQQEHKYAVSRLMRNQQRQASPPYHRSKSLLREEVDEIGAVFFRQMGGNASIQQQNLYIFARPRDLAVAVYTNNPHVARVQIPMDKVVVKQHFEKQLYASTRQPAANFIVAIKELG